MGNSDSNNPAVSSQPEPEDIKALQNKGAFFILLHLGLPNEDGLTFSEIRDKTGLANGTTQRRLQELEEAGWIIKDADLNESGKAVKKYYLSQQTNEMVDSLKELGKALLK